MKKRESVKKRGENLYHLSQGEEEQQARSSFLLSNRSSRAKR
jgi:hypothetical protein